MAASSVLRGPGLIDVPGSLDGGGIALPPLMRGRTRFPLELPGHSAFHSPLMEPMARRLDGTPAFAPPQLPLVDGSGRLWPAGDACDLAALREYADLATVGLEPSCPLAELPVV